MNHATTLMWLLVATLGLAKCAARVPEPQAKWAFVNGFGLGAAAAIRPLDAFAFALPAAVWLLLLAWRDKRRWVDVVASGIGVAIPFGAMMWVNAQSTGSPLLFGYEVLWGKAHGLGFHTAPWGAAHTPSRGLELISLYVTRLQTYLFETPFPSMVPVIAALALTKRVSALDRYLLRERDAAWRVLFRVLARRILPRSAFRLPVVAGARAVRCTPAAPRARTIRPWTRAGPARTRLSRPVH